MKRSTLLPAYLLSGIVIFLSPNISSAQHQLKMLWQTDSIISTPESVLYDASGDALYVSIIDGAPWEADGKGGIGKLSTDGKKYNSTWISGLHAPKGMAKHGNRLYVADISDLVVIDVAGKKIEKKISIPNATGLNDITVDSKGIVYVSDSKKGNIHRVENDIPTLFLDNKPGVNGLKAIGTDLYIFNGKIFEKADANKKITVIAELDMGGDGIEPVGNGDFLLSIWAGYVYYVQPDGKKELILDTHLEKKSSADIGYDPKNKIVYVPTFFAKTIAAYQLK